MSKKTIEKNPSLWKTVIVIWSEYNPTEEGDEDSIDIEDLAFEASQGNAYCSHADTKLIKVPEKDPHWDGTEFFLETEDEDEDEDEIDLVAEYERASGNTVKDDVVIVDNAGKYLCLFTEELAIEYLASVGVLDLNEGEE